MNADHAITPEIIQRELVRLTATSDRPSKVVVQPGQDEEGRDVVVIIFECDDIPAMIACLPIHLLFSVEEFSALALEPLADSWVTEKARLRELAKEAP